VEEKELTHLADTDRIGNHSQTTLNTPYNIKTEEAKHNKTNST
jgi:hypothetical protein